MNSQTAPTYSTPASPAVLPPGDTMRTDDLELARHVVNAINGDPGFTRSKITVSAREGNVYLRGSVNDRELMTRAERIASQIAGGSNWVHDDINVRG
ncbi:MAG: BON domain-containing protein [Bacillota bacterium]